MTKYVMNIRIHEFIFLKASHNFMCSNISTEITLSNNCFLKSKIEISSVMTLFFFHILFFFIYSFWDLELERAVIFAPEIYTENLMNPTRNSQVQTLSITLFLYINQAYYSQQV